MDTRVKERLVGAVILVAIIVALVPEMLRGPRNENATSQADGQVRTYTIDLSPSAANANSPPRERAPADSPTVIPAPLLEPAPAAPEPSNQPEATSPTTEQPVATRPQADPAPVESPVAKPPTARPPTAATARTPTVAETGWAVQLGSFASQENAERMAKNLRGRGYRAFVSRYDSGRSVRHRVRVGPEQDRSKAETLARRLSRELGQQVAVVAYP